MKPLWIAVLVCVLLALLGVFYVWYQNRRARESFKRIDHSQLKNMDADGWDD